MKASIKHVDELMKIQTLCYGPDMNESIGVFHSIVGSGLCFVIKKTHDDTIAGYLLAHYWHDFAQPPKLHEELTKCEVRRCCFIHDLAIMPQYRGMNYTRALLQELKDKINDLPCCLVSVNGTSEFWKKFGFVEQECSRNLLSTYSEDARFMRAGHLHL
jgi:ribosomal protein S18 acetylase RimI-like enzyme